MENKQKNAEHPYIILQREGSQDVAIVKGTNVHVWAIVGYRNLGMNPEEIVETLPHLSLAQVYDALSYYCDHKEEIEKSLSENKLTDEFVDTRQKKFKALVSI